MRIDAGKRWKAEPGRLRPGSRAALRGWLKWVLGLETPMHAMCEGHESPMDYLDHVFFERGGDAVVWANRGGGKTFYGAVATLLDLVFKPGVSVRILGGSLEQSERMYGYLRGMLDRPGLRGLIDGRMTRRGVKLINGSEVELLAQSQTSVRGQRVQKLRCDEVELFDREVWAAAQFVTRSAMCGDVHVRGSVEVMSTMHRPFGLVSELVGKARGEEKAEGTLRDGPPSAFGAGGWRLFQWCAMDVMARCEAERACVGCALWEECGGRAKRGRGFVSVQDVIDQKRRSGKLEFESEMLSRRPSRSDAVFSQFDPARHVRAMEAESGLRFIGGMDFGLRHPTVMLWAQVRERADGRMCIEVLDEQVASEVIVDVFIERMRERGWPVVSWLGVDPAGRQRSSQTGRSTIDLLRAAGYTVRANRTRLEDGLASIRRRLDPAAGEPTLTIHPRCRRLIESLSCYHFDADRPHSSDPVKDGYDHAVDALRYMVMNLEAMGGVSVVKW
ncbi:MAG: hypothetical protein GC162_16785 [Planctomycetes bacterium]|nr:hypothetical protein [Planctomycetota bacterium]